MKDSEGLKDQYGKLESIAGTSSTGLSTSHTDGVTMHRYAGTHIGDNSMHLTKHYASRASIVETGCTQMC